MQIEGELPWPINPPPPAPVPRQCAYLWPETAQQERIEALERRVAVLEEERKVLMAVVDVGRAVAVAHNGRLGPCDADRLNAMARLHRAVLTYDRYKRGG